MKTFSLLLSLVAVSLFAVGCGKPPTNNTDKPDTTDTQKEEDPHAGHNHDQSPKHGGNLI